MVRYLISMLALSAVAARGAIVESYGAFDIHYYAQGEVWNGLTNALAWNDTHKADMRAGIDEWDRVINNDPVRRVQLHVFWSDFDGPVLGGASSRLLNGTDGLGRPSVWTGTELVWREEFNYASDWDAVIRYDVDAAGTAWNFGEAAPGAFEIDFRSVTVHELGHTFGWLSSYDPDFDDFGYGGFGLTTYDRFLMDANGNTALNGGVGTPGNFAETGDPVYFTGFNATNLYGGLVPLYAPDPYEPGSSLSHLDTETFPDLVMSHEVAFGVERRTLSDLEIAMMADMGWDVIPEPGTLVMMMLTAAGCVFVRRVFLL